MRERERNRGLVCMCQGRPVGLLRSQIFPFTEVASLVSAAALNELLSNFCVSVSHPHTEVRELQI